MTSETDNKEVTSVDYAKLAGDINSEELALAKCACVACNSCTCACSCRRGFPEVTDIEW